MSNFWRFFLTNTMNIFSYSIRIYLMYLIISHVHSIRCPCMVYKYLQSGELWKLGTKNFIYLSRKLFMIQETNLKWQISNLIYIFYFLYYNNHNWDLYTQKVPKFLNLHGLHSLYGQLFFTSPLPQGTGSKIQKVFDNDSLS